MAPRSSPRINSPSSLRQRRSKSPPVNRRGDYEECENNEADYLIPIAAGSASKPKPSPVSSLNDGLVRALDYKVKLRSAFNILKLITGSIAVIVSFPVLAVVAYNASVLFGIYNPAPSCPAAKFEYPWCVDSFLHARELPPPLTGEEWVSMRRLYVQALTKAGVLEKNSFAQDWNHPEKVGFTLAFPGQLEIRNSLDKGRGIFATAPIKAGTKIWDSSYRGVFPNECTARIFFNQLNNAQKCDAMFWGYINDFYGNGMQYMLDMDGHGYINHVPHPGHNVMHHFDGEFNKVRYMVSSLSWTGSLFRATLPDAARVARNKPGAYGLYATRDIEPGEEILYDYNEIYMLGWWDWYTIFVESSLPVFQWLTI
jgi:hypothetical protein